MISPAGRTGGFTSGGVTTLRAALAVCATIGAAVAAEPPAAPRIDSLRLLGTHNSYHVAPDPFTLGLMATVVPDEARANDVTQRTLTEQLDRGLRHFELDCYLDPDGGLFAEPLALTLAARTGAVAGPLEHAAAVRQPGIKVLHSPGFDFRTTVPTLAAALAEVRRWSDDHPGHVPVFFLIECKQDSFSPTRPVPWSADGFSTLEREILAGWPRDRILAPDDVRRGHPTLREAVEGRGWPAVDACRGKVCFLLDNEGATRDLYLGDTPSLEGRLLFASVPRDNPAAAFMKRNDPVGSFAEIRALVAAGFLVRTRTDAGTVEARANDTARRDRAIASGAQLLSTDFPEPDPRFSDYHVRLPAPDEPAAAVRRAAPAPPPPPGRPAP